MSTGKWRFATSEIRRAIKATQSSGIEIARIEIRTDGTVAIVPGEVAPAKPIADDELEAWITKHAR